MSFTTHERDIPSLSTTAFPPDPISNPRTTLSFALPTSLAFFKRTTWEQTPWTSIRISPHDALSITTSISRHLPHPTIKITPEAVQNALCLGVAYDSTSNGAKAAYPHLYVVFPHLRREVTRDPRFIDVWHEEIVKPAFDEAWVQSGLVKVWERPVGEETRWGRVMDGVQTRCSAVNSSSILERLAKGSNASVHAVWPNWEDPFSGGSEGRFSDKRARIFDEAWMGMKGMLNGHGDLMEMQDPILLAVWKLEAVAEPGVSAAKVQQFVGRRWDAYVDSRFAVPGSFEVHFE